MPLWRMGNPGAGAFYKRRIGWGMVSAAALDIRTPPPYTSYTDPS